MARIPTISAQSITGLPGSAGGVKLTRTGVGAVPISTPITQRLNPAAFGQEGAAIAKLGETIFNDGVIPAIVLNKRNARAKQSLDESNRLYKEISALKTEMNKNTLDPGWEYRSKYGGALTEDEAWGKHWNGINTRINNLLPSINANVADKTHAIALSNAFLPQIMAMKLKSQNRQVKVNEERATFSYNETQKNLLSEMMGYVATATTSQSEGEAVIVFPGEKLQDLFRRKELNDTIFANSGVNALDRQRVTDAAQKKLVDEVTGALQTDPTIGKEFLAEYGEALGMTEGEIGETIHKLEQFEFLHIRNEQKKQEIKQTQMEQAAAQTLEPVKLDHLLQAIMGDLDLKTFVSTWADTYDRAKMTGWYDDIYKLISDKETLPGETDPATLVKYEFKMQQALGDPDIDPEVLALEIAAEPKLARAQKITEIAKLAAIKNNGALLKWTPYMQAKKYLDSMAPVPLDITDKTSSALRSRAIHNLWSQDINKLLMANDPSAFKKFNFFDRAKQLIDDHAALWGDPGSEGAQILLQDTLLKSGLTDEPGVSVGGGGDSRQIFPDVDAMKVALEKNAADMTVDEIRKALDSISTLDTFPGLRKKVQELQQAEELANQPKGPEPLTGFEKMLRDLTPDEWEDWGKAKWPEQYEKLYGKDQTQKVQPPPTPKKEPEDIPTMDELEDLIPKPKPEPKPELKSQTQRPQHLSNYNNKLAEELRKLNPLTMPKPTGPPKEGEPTTVFNEGAFDAWVWHPELNDWKIHGSSLDPRTGEVLKKPGHPTWYLMVREENKRGNKIVEINGKFYSVSAKDSVRKTLAKQQQQYYKKIGIKDITQLHTLRLTPTGLTTPFGMPVYRDQFKEKHSENATIYNVDDKYMVLGRIWPDPETGDARYFTTKEIIKLYRDNNFINPISKEKVQFFDTEEQAKQHTMDRSLVLQKWAQHITKVPVKDPGTQAGFSIYDDKSGKFLGTKTNAEMKDIRNIINDLAAGVDLVGDDYDDNNIITNVGAAREIWKEAPADVKQNPTKEALDKFWNQFMSKKLTQVKVPKTKTDTKVVAPETQKTINQIAELGKSGQKKILRRILNFANDKPNYGSAVRDHVRIGNKLWEEIKDEFKKNPNNEILIRLFEKYNLPFLDIRKKQ